MKNIETWVLSIIALLALVHYVASDTQSTVEGITVGNNKDHINCDGLICPPDTKMCRVTRKKDPKDESSFKLTRKCFGSDGAVTMQSEGTTMFGKFNSSVSVILVPDGDNGRVTLSNASEED